MLIYLCWTLPFATPLAVFAHRGQQRDVMAVLVRPARPIVRGCTGAHDDLSRRLLRQEALELCAREPLALDDLAAASGL
jgi:hypothetical protein